MQPNTLDSLVQRRSGTAEAPQERANRTATENQTAHISDIVKRGALTQRIAAISFVRSILHALVTTFSELCSSFERETVRHLRSTFDGSRGTSPSCTGLLTVLRFVQFVQRTQSITNRSAQRGCAFVDLT